MPPISNWKPPGWHRMETLDAALYRCAEAIDGVADIQEHFLAEDLAVDARPALTATNELLRRIRDDLIVMANYFTSFDVEGI